MYTVYVQGKRQNQRYKNMYCVTVSEYRAKSQVEETHVACPCIRIQDRTIRKGTTVYPVHVYKDTEQNQRKKKFCILYMYLGTEQKHS
jgi:hypothetical protein